MSIYKLHSPDCFSASRLVASKVYIDIIVISWRSCWLSIVEVAAAAAGVRRRRRVLVTVPQAAVVVPAATVVVVVVVVAAAAVADVAVACTTDAGAPVLELSHVSSVVACAVVACAARKGWWDTRRRTFCVSPPSVASTAPKP